ncbi:MAG: Gfo/Idh/MocA family protein, partial [Salinibacter sp.]
EIGEIYHVRSRFYQDVLADPNVAFSWRFDRQKAGSGALGDLGAHALAFARYLGGEIDQVCGMIDTFISERPTPPDDYRYGNSSTASDAEVERQRVENEDAAHALLRFRNKATGVLETSRVASGHKVGLDFEIVGSRGAIYFTHDRLNELNVYRADDGPGRRGFKTLMLGPDHPYYGEFWPVAGCGLGFGDLKTIEVYELLSGINEDIVLRPDFDDGWQVCRLSDAILTSAAEARWVSVDEIR